MKLYDIDHQTRIDEFGTDHNKFSIRDEIEYNFRRAKRKRNEKKIET